jgi:hypothetical protein
MIGERITWYHKGIEIFCLSVRGSVLICAATCEDHLNYFDYDMHDPGDTADNLQGWLDYIHWAFGPTLGFAYGQGSIPVHCFTAPCWPIVVITALLPLLRAGRLLRRRRRIAMNQCAVCGYDLRATPDRCPECGAKSKGATQKG